MTQPMTFNVTPATWRIPAGHEAVSAFASIEEARQDARQRVTADRGHMYYLSDKRGSWEVIRAPRGGVAL